MKRPESLPLFPARRALVKSLGDSAQRQHPDHAPNSVAASAARLDALGPRSQASLRRCKFVPMTRGKEHATNGVASRGAATPMAALGPRSPGRRARCSAWRPGTGPRAAIGEAGAASRADRHANAGIVMRAVWRTSESAARSRRRSRSRLSVCRRAQGPGAGLAPTSKVHLQHSACLSFGDLLFRARREP